MSQINCNYDSAWNAYLDDNLALRGFEHLRPQGVVWLPAYEPPPPTAFMVFVAGHPVETVAAALAYIETPMPEPVAYRPVPAVPTAARDAVPPTVLAQKEPWRFAMKTVRRNGSLVESVEYSFMADTVLLRHGDRTVERSEEEKLRAIGDLTFLFSNYMVRVFYLWGPAGDTPATHYSPETMAMDKFYMSGTRRMFKPTVVWIDDVVAAAPEDSSPEGHKLGAFILHLTNALYFTFDWARARQAPLARAAPLDWETRAAQTARSIQEALRLPLPKRAAAKRARAQTTDIIDKKPRLTLAPASL